MEKNDVVFFKKPMQDFVRILLIYVRNKMVFTQDVNFMRQTWEHFIDHWYLSCIFYFIFLT